MNQKKEKYLVCCALPYANGPLHIGHLAGCYIPGDVYTRFRRLQGHDVHFVCGSDEYGVPNAINAHKLGITPKEFVDKYHEILKNDLANFSVDFDIFSRTTHPCHTKRSQDFFTNLNKVGLIETRTEKRLYCGKDKQFLPDRYVIGECPKCHSPGARGDQCEKCGAWYEPEDLINPICQICKETSAEFKETKHWYLCLNKVEKKLKAWLESKTHWRKNVLGYAFQPIKAELMPRSITRDMAWGIPVPLEEAKGKVLYVWFDAPIGYISASEDWSIRNGTPDKWKDYWEDKDTKLIHFIGKDNIVFHTVVWPSVLIGDGRYILPDLVCGNEFLNLEGEKISTSRNFAIWAGDVVKIIEPDLLRYYLTRISPETSDSNFTWADYQNRINSELADVIGNLVNRTLSFLLKNYSGAIQQTKPDSEVSLFVKKLLKEKFEQYTTFLENGYSRGASDVVLDLARALNVLFQEKAPWKVFKEDKQKAGDILSAIAFGIKGLVIMLYPICPNIAQKILGQLGFSFSVSSVSFDEIFSNFSADHKISAIIAPIVTKVEDSFIEEQVRKLG